MKYVKTYEGFIGNMWFKIFSNKYIKEIVINLSKLLEQNPNSDFNWSYVNKNEICLFCADSTFNWITISIRPPNFLSIDFITQRYTLLHNVPNIFILIF